MTQPWAEEQAPQLGPVVGSTALGTLPQLVKETLTTFDPSPIRPLRQKTDANLGYSAITIVNHLVAQVKVLNMSDAEQIAQLHDLAARVKALEAATHIPLSAQG